MLVMTKQGLLQGTDEEGYSVFRGVPYAMAPVDSLRFRAPQPPARWEGIRHADAFSPQCPQLPITDGLYGKEFYTDPRFPLPPQDEDCLYLNLWVPEKTESESFPVAVWIHGGGFDHGFGSEMEFDGAAWAERKTILVTINYRVGVFGFFAHPLLQEEDENNSCGNYGILDQIAALKWVKENISAFGGDPSRITIFGQSAGAMSVQTLVSSPLSRELVSGAVLQSGGGLNNGLNRDYSLAEAFANGEAIMDLCHASDIQEMRSLPAHVFTDILPELYAARKRVFHPVLDGYVLQESYTDAAVHGHTSNVPYIIGMTADDIGVSGGNGKQSSLYTGCLNWAGTMSGPVYVYYFSHPLPGDDAGSFHSSELWYTFHTLDRCWRPMKPEDYRLSEEMVNAWTSFVKYGSPGEDWPAWTKEAGFVKEFQ